MDVMRDLATPLPVLVIAQMMGVPDRGPALRQAARRKAAVHRPRRARPDEAADRRHAGDDRVRLAAGRRAHRQSRRRFHLGAGERREAGRLHPASGAGEHLAAAAGRPRDDDQPAVQRHAGVHPPSRPMGAVEAGPGRRAPSGRPRSACATIRRSNRSSGSPRRMSRCAARCCARTTGIRWFISSANRDPEHVRRTRTRSTSRGCRTSMWRSARACITASGRRWRGWRARRCSRPWPSASPASGCDNEELEYQPSITFRSLKSLPVTWH